MTAKKDDTSDDVTVVAEPSDAAVKVAKEDAEWRAAHPNEPRTRDAAEVGGESFTYLDNVSG